MANVSQTTYKVVYFTDNNVIQCRTFATQTEATNYAGTLATNKWKVVLSYVTSQNVTEVST